MLKYFRNSKVPVFMTPTIKMDIADKLIEKVMNCVFILGKMEDICKGSAEITNILVVNLKQVKNGNRVHSTMASEPVNGRLGMKVARFSAVAVFVRTKSVENGDNGMKTVC